MNKMSHKFNCATSIMTLIIPLSQWEAYSYISRQNFIMKPNSPENQERAWSSDKENNGMPHFSSFPDVTDGYSWKHYIDYPACIEKMDAKTALLIQTRSRSLFLASSPKFLWEASDFTMELSGRLSSLILPQSDENAVYIFRCIKK